MCHGMPRGHEHDPIYSLSIYGLSSGKNRASLYISWEKGDHYYIQTWHNDLFSHYNLFKGKLKEKLARKALLNTDTNISERTHLTLSSQTNT